MGDALTLTEIQQLHHAGQLEEAKLRYEHFLEENPDDVTALHLLGILYAEMGELDSAQRYLEKALTFQPNHVALCLHLANILKSKRLV